VEWWNGVMKLHGDGMVPFGQDFNAFGEQIKLIRRIDRPGGVFLFFAEGVNR
jgi:hypothetical protein